MLLFRSLKVTYEFLILSLGMFLYSRIVIDNVVDLINIDDIRKELKALPKDLDAA